MQGTAVRRLLRRVSAATFLLQELAGWLEAATHGMLSV